MSTKPNTKTFFLVSTGLLVALLVTTGCGFTINYRSVRGSGHLAEQTYDVQEFHAVSFGGIGEVTIEISDEESLHIEAEDNLLKYYHVEVRDGVLEIEMLPGHVNLLPTKQVKIFVSAKSLDGLTLAGLGSITAPELTGDACNLAASGSGSVTVETLSCTDLDLNISGLGDVTINGGQVDTQDVSISGMGNYQAGDLQSRQAEFHISGMGNSTIWVTESLEVSISGAGDLEYYGQPHLNTSGSGLGHVDSLGDK